MPVVLYLKLFYFFLQSGDCPLRLISRTPVAEQLGQYCLEATPGCQKMVLDVGRGAYVWLAVAQVLGWVFLYILLEVLLSECTFSSSTFMLGGGRVNSWLLVGRVVVLVWFLITGTCPFCWECWCIGRRHRCMLVCRFEIV